VRAERGDDPAGTVRRPDRDAIAGLDAGRDRRARRGLDELAERAVGEPPVRLDDRLGVGPRGDRRRDRGGNRLVELARLLGRDGTLRQTERIDTPATPGAP
jgi:hypothetical protein